MPRDRLQQELRDLHSQLQSGNGHVTPPSEEAATFLLSVLATVPDFIASVSLEGNIRYLNRIGVGFEMEKALGLTIWDYIRPEWHAKVREVLEQVRITQKSGAFHFSALGPDGAPRHYDAAVGGLVREGQVTGYSIVFHDVTGATEEQTRRKESDERLRLAVEAAHMGLWSWDARSNVVEWDDAMCGIFGVEPGGGPTTYDSYLAMLHPDDRASIHASILDAMRTGVYRDLEHRVIWPDGSVHWVFAKGTIFRDADGKPLKIIGGLVDITERKRFDEQLRQAQKMEAVGQLTAGIAHNFNNLLMAMLPSVDMALRIATPQVAHLLDEAHQAGRRAAEMVRQLMTFTHYARDGLAKAQPLVPLVERTIAMCRTTFDRRIAIELVQHAAPSVCVNSRSFEQALLNILLNARDALAHAAAARVVVEIDEVSRDGSQMIPADVRGDRVVRVAIRDNGCGMDAATSARVFEPFFTTKPIGEGTGLGLATAYAIVRDAGGHLSLESTPGEGTSVTLWLPSSSPAVIDAVVERGEAAPSSSEGKRERILIVDDEDLVRRVLVRILKAAGYQVVPATGGDEAFAACSGPGVFDLALLDVSMPGLTGQEVATRLRAIDPQLKLVFLTGYASSAVSQSAGALILEKPIEVNALLAAVRQVLDDAGYVK